MYRSAASRHESQEQRIYFNFHHLRSFKQQIIKVSASVICQISSWRASVFYRFASIYYQNRADEQQSNRTRNYLEIESVTFADLGNKLMENNWLKIIQGFEKETDASPKIFALSPKKSALNLALINWTTIRSKWSYL